MSKMLSGIEPDLCISNNEIIDVLLSVLVALGLLISFLPQVYKIIKYKTSEGISPWFLMFGTISVTCILFNIVILQFRIIKCCRIVPGLTCLENTLGIIQLAILWFMCVLVTTLYMLYFPSHRKLAPYIRHLHFNTPPTKWSIEWRNSIIVAITVIVHFIFTTTVTILLLLFCGHQNVNWTKTWADFLGIMSMVLISIQFIPQLYRTWRRKSVGALSIQMMIMQVPGLFIFVYTLAIRPGTNWTTWIVFFVSGCLQGILLIMCICWHYRAKRLGYGPFYVGETDQLLDRDGRPLLPDERTRLLNKAHRRNPSSNSRSPRPSSSRGSSYYSNGSINTPPDDPSVTNIKYDGYVEVKS